MKPEIIIVVAMDEKRGIGKDGKLPWPRIPEDIQRFKDETLGNPVIMGRKTYESIPQKFRPLPDRQNIVITRNIDLELPGCNIAHSLAEAIDIATSSNPRRISIIGGGEVYRSALAIADTLYLTQIEGDFDADTFFPEYKNQFPYLLKERRSEYQGLNYSFVDLTRNNY